MTEPALACAGRGIELKSSELTFLFKLPTEYQYCHVYIIYTKFMGHAFDGFVFVAVCSLSSADRGISSEAPHGQTADLLVC